MEDGNTTKRVFMDFLSVSLRQDWLLQENEGEGDNPKWDGALIRNELSGSEAGFGFPGGEPPAKFAY